MTLLLARHGQTAWNASRRFQGSTDIELSERGRAQAEALGRALATRRLAAVYVSPLQRARETAALALGARGKLDVTSAISCGRRIEERPGFPGALPSGGGMGGEAGPPISLLNELRELSLGEWEGRTVDEIRSQDGDPYLAWLRAPHDCLPPGGEPLDQVASRVRQAFERIAAAHAPEEEVLVIAHGGVISVYACDLLGSSFNSLWRLRVDNCSLTVIKPPRLVSINDTSHLAAELTGQHLTRA